jgi:hypothetical protein
MITGILRGGYCGAVVCIAACAAAACDVGNGDPQSFADRPQSTEVRVTMLNAERESRTVFDYDLGDRPRARLGLAPPLGNRSVTFLLQGKSGGIWLDARSEDVLTDAQGRATVVLPRLRVGTFRAQAHFVGDAASAGSSSDWVYFRIDPPER